MNGQTNQFKLGIAEYSATMRCLVPPSYTWTSITERITKALNASK